VKCETRSKPGPSESPAQHLLFPSKDLWLLLVKWACVQLCAPCLPLPPQPCLAGCSDLHPRPCPELWSEKDWLVAQGAKDQDLCIICEFLSVRELDLHSLEGPQGHLPGLQEL
jgi:hypothetical protein